VSVEETEEAGILQLRMANWKATHHTPYVTRASVSAELGLSFDGLVRNFDLV
jgi:hypothetical protein